MISHCVYYRIQLSRQVSQYDLMSTQTSLLKVWLSQHISNIIDPSESVLLLELELILKHIFRSILNYHHYVKRRIVPERKERVKGNCYQCQVPPMPSVCRSLADGVNERDE